MQLLGALILSYVVAGSLGVGVTLLVVVFIPLAYKVIQAMIKA